MTTTVFKETVNLAEMSNKISLMLPAFAEVLTVQEQFKDSGTIQVWYRCSPENHKDERSIHVIGTGHSAPNKSMARYLSTVILMGGQLVLHFFEDGAA